MKFTLITCLALMAICFRATTDKETPDWTGTTQGEHVVDIQTEQDIENIMHLHNCIRISNKAQNEQDSINGNINGIK